MPLSTNTYTYNGGPQTFAATFADGYIEREHVAAYRVGDFDGLGEQIYLDFTWNSDAEILVTNSLTAGDEIVVQRTVPKDAQLVDLSSEGGLTRESLERNARQSLHAVHEVLDGRTTDIENIDQLVAQAEAAAQQALDAVATVEAVEWRSDGSVVTAAAAVVNARNGIRAVQDGTNPNLVHLELDGAATGGLQIQKDSGALSDIDTLNVAGDLTVDIDNAVATVRYKGTPRYYDSHVLRTDIGLGVLADGDLFLLHNEPMRVHRAWDGNARSWLFNNNGYVNYGVKTENNLPLNYYMFVGFKTQDNNKLFIHTSPDGRRFYRMNQEPIMRGAGDSTIGGRDSQAFWNRWLGEFWFPVTSGIEVTTYDASTFRSPDLVAFDNSTILLGNDGIRGEMVDQGEIPVRRQWSNRFYDFDNKLYIITSLQVLENQPNAFGGDGPALRPYIAEVLDASDPDNLVFGPVTQMDFGPTDDAKLDPDFIKVDGVFYACIKDSSTRTIEVWSGTDLFGTFTKLETIDLNTDPADFNSLEGPTWAVHRYFNPDNTEEVLVKYRIHLANNRDANDKLIGVPRFTEATSPAGPYGAIERLEFSHATRNGTTTNLAMVDDPRALRVALAAEGIYGGMTVDGVDEAHQLDAGTHLLYPQEKFEYFILGEAGSTQVTINEKVANTFYVAVHNSNPAATVEFLATDWCRPFTVGGGKQQLVQVVWSKQIGKYIPVGFDDDGTGGSNDGVVNGVSFNTSSNILTLQRSVGADLTVDLSALAGGGSADGVIDGLTFNATSRVLTVSRTVGADLTVTIPADDQFDNWGQTGNNIHPTVAGTDVGTSVNPVAGVWFEGQSVDGSNDGNNDYRLIFSNSGAPRVQSPTTTGNNQGFDLSARTNWYAVSITSTGTVTWSRDNGSGLILTGAAGQATTVDFSSLSVGETMEITINNPNGQVFTFNGPRAVDWVNDTDPPNDVSREVDIVFEYQNTSSLRGIWVQRRA